MSSLGVDLDRYHEDVARILRWRFADRIRAAGLEFDDVLQAVYRSILTRNKGKNPYNPERGAVTTYIYRVCWSVCVNEWDKQRRRRLKEVVGAWHIDRQVDAALVAVDDTSLDVDVWEVDPSSVTLDDWAHRYSRA